MVSPNLPGIRNAEEEARPPPRSLYFSSRVGCFFRSQLLAKFDVHLAVWLLFLKDDLPVDDFFSDVHVPFNCLFLVAQSANDTVQLTEVYRVSSNHPLTVSHYGVWKQNYSVFRRGNLYDRRNSLQGLSMRAVSVNVS